MSALAQAGLAVQLNRILENMRRSLRENAPAYHEAIVGRWVEATDKEPRHFVVPKVPPTVAQVAAVVHADAEGVLRCLSWVLDALDHEVKGPALRVAMDAHAIDEAHVRALHDALVTAAEAQRALTPTSLDDLTLIPQTILPLVAAAPAAQVLDPEMDWWWESQRAHEHVPPEHSLWPV